MEQIRRRTDFQVVGLLKIYPDELRVGYPKMRGVREQRLRSAVVEHHAARLQCVSVLVRSHLLDGLCVLVGFALVGA